MPVCCGPADDCCYGFFCTCLTQVCAERHLRQGQGPAVRVVSSEYGIASCPCPLLTDSVRWRPSITALGRWLPSCVVASPHSGCTSTCLHLGADPAVPPPRVHRQHQVQALLARWGCDPSLSFEVL